MRACPLSFVYFHIGYSDLHKTSSARVLASAIAVMVWLCMPAASHAGATCPIPKTANIEPPSEADDKTRMTSDTAEVEEDGSSRLRGNVRLERGGNSLEADELYFNPNTGVAEVKGDARFRTPNLRVESRRATIKVDSQEGEFVGTHFAMTDTGARGEAKRLSSEAGVITLEGTHYTTCPADDEFWLLRADKIALNTNTGWGEAWDSKIRVLDTTVFYLPYIWFPIDDRRQSGFLPPSVGNSSDTGFDFSIPYYINLAPNYDATLIPRYMSKRGHQINGEFRYLTSASRGEFGAEYLYKDEETDETRDLQFYRHQGRITRNTALHIDYTSVSDRLYFDELDNTLAASSRNFLDQRLLYSWHPGSWFSADFLASRYQTITRRLTISERPYERMPRLRAMVHSPNVHGLRFDLGTEVTRFEHVDESLVNGWRYHLEPALELNLDNSASWWHSRLAYRYTSYSLENAGAGIDDSPTRGIPSFSSDLGLRFERLMNNGGLHLLEPRLYYLYVGEEDQNELPLFDAGEPDFYFERLFVENRYLGKDRIGDAHHVAVALTNRWLDPATGRERTRLSIGQILRFDEPEVSLPAGTAPDPHHSQLAAEVVHYFSDNWSSALLLLLDTEDTELDRASARLRYYDERERLFAVAYRFRDQILEQTDISFAWPLAENWKIIGRNNYSLEYSENIESLLAIEYTDCCWGIRGGVRRYISGQQQDQKNAIYLELNLLGLGRFGRDFDRLLERDTLRSVYE